MDIKERLSLDAVSAHTLESAEHRHRYELAASLLEGRRVLDLCCGIGYGTLTLAETAAEVVGVDRDAGAIDTATVLGADAGNVRFETADAVAYLAEHGEEFDAIVCYEGLEHLDRLDAATAILVELAAHGTAMMLSVPNSRTFAEENPYHVTDFGYDEALAFFGRLPDATVLHQHVAEGSLISSDSGDRLEARLLHAEHGEPEYANNFIAAVNLGERAGDLVSGRAHLTITPWHNRYLRNLEKANRELIQTNTRLARSRLGTYDSAAAARLSKMRELQRRAEEAERRAEEFEEQLGEVWERTLLSEQIAEQARIRAEAAEARLRATRLYRTRRLASRLLRPRRRS
jgi:2-polyprenyl-3-methyl-5-hydroxy-6-metoxy-1,4-benzoquinol methylase